MIRGTTPTLEIELPFDSSELSEMYITLSQNKEVIIDKDISECVCDGVIVTLRLSQEDTLKLSDRYNTEIQIRAKTQLGDVIASDIMTVPTYRILKDGVI